MLRAKLLVLTSAMLATLSGCSSPAEKAQQRYEFLQNNGASRGEVCDAGKAVAAAYADAGDARRFREANVIANVDCTLADLDGRGMPYRAAGEPAIEADNMEIGR